MKEKITTDKKSLNKVLKRTNELTDRVRDLINHHRIQNHIMKSLGSWHQVCSSLNVIGDTVLGIEAYLKKRKIDPWVDGYLLLYGLLQLLFVQQDSIEHLSFSCDVHYSIDPALEKIREIRNDAIGHPTNRGRKQGKRTFIQVSRPTINKESFEYLRWYEDDREMENEHVSTLKIIKLQVKLINIQLESIIEHLTNQELEHRMKYRKTRLIDLFDDSFDYWITGLTREASGVNCRGDGVYCVEKVISALSKYREALLEREEIRVESYEKNEHLDFALDMLKGHFSRTSPEQLDARLAYILAKFISWQIDFVKESAEQVDEEYASNKIEGI